MSAPDRIWAVAGMTHGWEDGHCTDSPVESAHLMSMVTEYVRADLAPQWQDIATAPKDGTHFLAYDECGDMYRAAYGEYETLMSFCGQYVVETPEPTHWMPLPTPPEPAP